MDMGVKAGGNATTIEQPKNKPSTRPPQLQRSRSLAGEGRGDGRIEAHHRRGQPRSRSRAHHLSGRPGEKPGAVVREHQGPSRPQSALQHDRLQPVAVLPDDRRGAGRSSAEGGAAVAEEARAQDGAGRGAGRERDLQPEHRRRRQDRHPHVPGAADVAARRRHVSRHRRLRHHQGSGDRPHQRRHLPHDDQGPARDRRLHLAGQGRQHRPRQVVEDGQADADRSRLRHRSAAVPGRRDRACRRPKASTNIIPASRARRSSCSPPTSPACRCRRTPRSSSKAISIRTRPSPKARSASSPAITAGRAAPRPTCASSGCATATTRR